MPAFNNEVDANASDLKAQRASRRSVSLNKDRKDFRERSVSSHGRKASAAPVGSEFATPHRAARAATRTCLAKGAISESSDMPQISMGHAGHWVRWVRKPSVAKAGKMPLEDLDDFYENASVMMPRVQDSQSWSKDDDIVEQVHKSACPANILFDLNDQTMFPSLGHQQPKATPKVLCDEASVDSAASLSSEVVQNEMTPEKLSQSVLRAENTTEQDEDTSVAKREDAVADDWVVLSIDDVKAAASSNPSRDISFDAQHPRNMFAKMANAKPVVSKVEPESAAGIDWTQAGMPIELIRRIVRGSVNAAHHGPHCEKKVSQVPLDVMRAQNAGSAKRQSSTPRTPRSQSKPRANRSHSSGRR